MPKFMSMYARLVPAQLPVIQRNRTEGIAKFTEQLHSSVFSGRFLTVTKSEKEKYLSLTLLNNSTKVNRKCLINLKLNRKGLMK